MTRKGSLFAYLLQIVKLKIRLYLFYNLLYAFSLPFPNPSLLDLMKLVCNT